jgi:hypothetical protein
MAFVEGVYAPKCESCECELATWVTSFGVKGSRDEVSFVVCEGCVILARRDVDGGCTLRHNGEGQLTLQETRIFRLGERGPS